MRDDRALDENAITDALSVGAARVLAELEASPGPAAIPLADRGSLRELERRGDAVQAAGSWFAASAVAAAAGRLSGLLSGPPGGFTVADARDALATSRRHVLPLLAHLDRPA